jgi:hypothetical protein
MLNERVMSPGSWNLKMSLEAKELWSIVDIHGHIVITPQWVDHRHFDTDAMLTMARFAGPILKKTQRSDGLELEGQGMVWWLGDSSNVGPIIETKVTLTSSTLENALDELLPDAIVKGVIDEPPGTFYTGEHEWETPLEAIRTVVASMECEYRVNPDGTIDAGPNNDVYNIDNPVIVVQRGNLSGGDTRYKGVDVDTLTSILDGNQYVTRAIVVTTDSNNVTTLVGGQDRSPATDHHDMHGNLLDRALMLQASGSPVEVSLYLNTQMNEHTYVQNMEISTEFTEIQNGDLRIGDAFWCYDPPAFVDLGNEVHFRGQIINPVKLRLIAATTPIVSTMGVYYRPPTAAPVALDWTDLTPYIKFEDGTNNRIGVRR